MDIENSMPIAALENLRASRLRSQSLDFEVTNELLRSRARSDRGVDRFVKNELARDVYRHDTRSPRLVNKVGFEGTIADDNVIASFDNRTVFASERQKGTRLFAEMMNNNVHYKDYKHYFLYKISDKNVMNISFVDTYIKSPLDYLKSILPKVINENIDYYNEYMEKNSFGLDKAVKHAAEDIDGRLRRAFVATREIHLKGPIKPVSITYKGIKYPRLDYVDLAIL